LVEAVERDGADDHRLRAVGDAILDLRYLLGEVGVAAGLDQLHLDPEILRLLDDAVIDGEPIRVLHVREGDADVPLLIGLLEWAVLDFLARPFHVEGRIVLLYRERIPGLLCLPLALAPRADTERDRAGQQAERRCQPSHAFLLCRLVDAPPPR